MRNRHFNWKFFVVILIGMAVLSATAIGLRYLQRGRRAYQGITLGNKAYEQGDWPEAASQLGRYLIINHDDIPILLKYADAQLNIRPLKANIIQQAIAAYRNVLQLDPGNEQAAINLTRIYLNISMPGDAQQAAGRALQAIQSPQLRLLYAQALAGQRNFKEAAAELEKLIKYNPDEIKAYESLAKLIEQRPEDFNTSAQSWLDAAVSNNPDSAQALVSRGSYYLYLGFNEQAIEDFNLARSRQFNDPNVRISLAEKFVESDLPEKGREQLELAQRLDPENQSLWRVWALLAVKTGSQQLMIDIADKGLKELQRQPWDFMPTAAELYIRGNQIDKASQCLSQLRQKDVAPAITAFLEGLLNQQKDQKFEALKCWQKALEQGSDPATVRLAMARMFAELGDSKSAIKQLRTLVSEQPKNVDARIELADLLGDQGRWDESAQNARIAVELAPKDINAVFADAIAKLRLVSRDADGNKNPKSVGSLENELQMLDERTNSIEAKLLKIQLAINISDFNKAQSLLNQIKDSNISDARITLAQANLLIAQDKTNQAVNILTEAIDKSPDSIVLIESLVDLLPQKDSRKQCEDVLNRAMAQSKLPLSKKQIGLLMASIYTDSNELAKRCGIISRLYEQFPEDISIMRSKLTCINLKKDLPVAQNIVDKIKLLEGPQGWQWRYELARIWFAQDDFKVRYPQIVILLKENLQSDSDDQESRTLLAATYEKANDRRLAISTYEEALNHSAGDARLIAEAASAMYRAGEYERADRIIRQALVKSSIPLLKDVQLQSFLRRGQYESAGNILENIFTTDTNNIWAGLTLAILKIQQRQFDQAEQLLSLLHLSDPNSLPVTSAMVELNLKRGKSNAAIEICDELVERLKNPPALILRGKTLSSLGRKEQALADIGNAISIEPNNIETLLACSEFYHSIGLDDEALADIRRALLLESDNISLRKYAIFLHLNSEDQTLRRQGRAMLETALMTYPDDVELLIYKARFLISQDTTISLNDAQAILEGIKQQQPQISEVWMLLAQIAIRQNQTARAIDITLEGLSHRSTDKSLLLLRAQLEAAKSAQLAIPTLRALREAEPNDAQTAVYLAQLFIASGDNEQAMNLLESQINSTDIPADKKILKIALGAALQKSGKQNESAELFKSLQESFPDDPSPLIARIRILKDDKMWSAIDRDIQSWLKSHNDDQNVPLAVTGELISCREEEPLGISEKLLRRVLTQKPDSIKANLSLAMLLQNTGRSKEASEIYKKILDFDTDNITAINNRAWILCEDQNQFRQALDLANQGLQIEPNNIDLLDTRAVALFRLGQLQRADEDLNRCVILYPAGSPSLAASHFHLARVQAKLGQPAKAIESLKKALDLNGLTGGLSAVELAEAQNLFEKLSQGGN